MNNPLKKINKSFARLRKRVFGQTKVPGLLGRADGQVVAGDGIVYATLKTGEVITVANAKVANRPYMKVWIGQDEHNPSTMQVLSERFVYGKPLTGSLPLHGDKHKWPKEDTVWVDGNQFVPLLAIPGATAYSVKLYGSTVKWIDGTQYVNILPIDLDLSSLIPTDGALYALLQVDDTGTLTAKAGTQVEAPELLGMADIPLPDTGQLELWAVRLYSGMDRIHKDRQVNDFVDLRWGRGGSGGGGGGTWGSITGLLSDQADLQAALDAKQDTLGFTPEDAAKKGVANGYAELDSSGKVPAAQLPAYVDDVLEFANFAALPATGSASIIYITLDTNLTYRWSGSAYVEISASLALGETSSTAYRGDRGKTAYDHSQVTGNPHGTTADDVGAINKSLATAVSQFLVSSGAGAWVIKTVAEVKTLLSLAALAYKATVGTSDIDLNAVTNAVLAKMAANTIKANATASSADPQDVALAANQTLGRKSTGNISAQSVTDAAWNLLDDADTATMLSTLGAVPNDGWTAYTAVTPTRTAADDPTYTIRFAGVDLTGVLQEGMPIKWTQNSIVRYGWISSAPSYSGGNTSLTVLTRLDNSSSNYDVLDTATYAISAFYYGRLKQPGFGFPVDREKWTLLITDTTDRTQSSPTAGTYYQPGSLGITVPIGQWRLGFVGVLSASVTNLQVSMQFILSTTTNSISDGQLAGYQISYGTTVVRTEQNVSRLITLAAKTTYNLLIYTGTSGVTSLSILPSSGVTTKIYAECTYL